MPHHLSEGPLTSGNRNGRTRKLTQEAAERAKPLTGPDGDRRDTIYWDTQLKGFALICRAGGSKTWILQREVQGRTARVTIGRFPDMPAAEARKKAEAESAKMKGGYNPHAARAAELTLDAALGKYLEVKVNLRPGTRDWYRDTFDRYLKDHKPNGVAKPFGQWPLFDLAKHAERVEEMFAFVTREHGKASGNGAAQIVRAVYNHHAKYHDDWPRNPVRFTLNRMKPRKTIIPYDQFEVWAQAVMTLPNPIRRAGNLFMLLSGMRDKATREMEWAHVDWKQRTLLVPEPKGGELNEFTLPLSTQMVTILERLRVYSTEPWAFGRGSRFAPEGSQWVFPAILVGNKFGHVATFYEQKRPTLTRRAALVNPHSLRRSFVTRAVTLIPKAHVSMIVNHAVEERTMTDLYIVEELEPLRRSQQMVSDALMAMLKVPLETILGPVQDGNRQTFGQQPPWRDAA